MIEDIKHIDCPSKDLTEVGPNKPLGSLAPFMIGTRTEVEELLKQLDMSGIRHIEIPTQVGNYGSIIMGYDPEALGKLLEEHSTILDQSMWPTECEAFIKRTVEEIVAVTNPVFDIITKAYGNSPEETRRAIDLQQKKMWDEMWGGFNW